MNDKFLISYRELKVYQTALEGAMEIFELSRKFPDEERNQLTRSLVEATRLICVCIAQAWQRRRYESAFVARLNQAESDAAAAQVWLELAILCHYLDAEKGQELHHRYFEVMSDLSRLIGNSAAWAEPD